MTDRFKLMARDFMGGVFHGIKTAAEMEQGRAMVQQWVDCRPDRALLRMTEAVTAAVHDERRGLVIGALNEFARQVASADSLERQQEVGQLFWQFKGRLREELEGARRSYDEFVDAKTVFVPSSVNA